MIATKMRNEKQGVAVALSKMLRDCVGFVAVDYRGITVAEISKLRAGLRALGTRMTITKNTVLRFALGEAGFNAADYAAMLSGPTAIVFVKGDLGPALKLLLLDVRDDFRLVIKQACIEGNAYNADQVKALSDLPGRKQLLAQLLGTLNAPAQQLAGVLQAVPQALVRVLDAAKEKMEK